MAIRGGVWYFMKNIKSISVHKGTIDYSKIINEDLNLEIL